MASRNTLSTDRLSGPMKTCDCFRYWWREAVRARELWSWAGHLRWRFWRELQSLVLRCSLQLLFVEDKLTKISLAVVARFSFGKLGHSKCISTCWQLILQHCKLIINYQHLIIHPLPTLISAYKRQHLNIHQLPMLTLDITFLTSVEVV